LILHYITKIEAYPSACHVLYHRPLVDKRAIKCGPKTSQDAVSPCETPSQQTSARLLMAADANFPEFTYEHEQPMNHENVRFSRSCFVEQYKRSVTGTTALKITRVKGRFAFSLPDRPDRPLPHPHYRLP
jgi:hypothetical protein